MKHWRFSPSRASADFVAGLRYQDIPEEVIEAVKKYILDWIGCAIGGAVHPASGPIKSLVETLGGKDQADIIGGTGSNAFLAALSHAYYGHILEMDDVERRSITHPATVVVPAALAVAGRAGKTGEDLILSVIGGYEVLLRIGAAIVPAHYEVFHTTSTAGVFGAAMAAGKMLGLDRQYLNWALGNAGSLASGLMQFLQEFLQGGMSKFLHAGTASAQGVLVALLAEKGLGGAEDILEGEKGFFAGFARQEVDERIFGDFGKRWRTLDVSVKAYPCCRHTHSAIDAALEIGNRAGGRSLKEIRLFTYRTAVGFVGCRNPVNSRQARFSMTYCIASALLRGAPVECHFTDAAVVEKPVSDLEKSIQVIVDDEIDALVPEYWPARVEVVTEDGEKLVAQANISKGDPENPLDWDAVGKKFRMQTEGIITGATQDELIGLCRKLETVPSAGVLVSTVNTTFLKRC
ncbi:MmgE/PrpD family protein [Oxalobacter aliiformigenes]|uniref:MmgE/PrpD family protein n=1 Tax=Oxalobacter aliiformigenes TaxID=2946593 RepID=UPI0022AE58F6|nr:MmgE/PrpD family protein [Oxalobacter aliiformigenes]MCZ4064640.1 MmgE/PrpD family protein [Oxalobacter aliiformigenes]WAV99113.1 MmgE/PrpD family protein [Oxalobacter aliiformigenes]